MKKILIISLTCMLVLLSFSSFSLAMDSENNVSEKTKTETIVNEYEMLQSLSDNTDPQLAEFGYDSEEIKVIKNYHEEYVKYLKKLAELEDENLINLGYNAKQIEMLRTYDGDVTETAALSATLNLSLSSDYCIYYSSYNRTDARVVYNFAWAGVPLIKTTDIVAVQWNNWDLRGNSGNIIYKHIYGSQPDIIGYPTLKNPSSPLAYGRGHTFAMTKQDNYYWAQSGTGIFSIRHSGSAQNLSAYAEYGHSTVVGTPSFSIPGGASISFSAGVSTADQDWEDRSYTTQ